MAIKAYINSFFRGIDLSMVFSCPDVIKIADVYGIKPMKIEKSFRLGKKDS